MHLQIDIFGILLNYRLILNSRPNLFDQSFLHKCFWLKISVEKRLLEW